MAKSGRFWRNVVVIAVAHIALIAGLIRWSLAARASNPESIVWLGAAQDLAAEESGNEEERSGERNAHVAQQKPPKNDEAKEEKPAVTTKSEIELSTPKPTPTPPSKPTATPIAKPKGTSKPIPKSIPKRALVAKASPKPSLKPKQSSAKSSEKSAPNEKTALAKNESQSQSGSGKPGSTGKVSHAGGGTSASEFGWYGNMLHDRFYSAWIQPTTHMPTGAKISTLVKVRIEKDGHVSKFEIIKPSENAVVNESVAAVAKQVTEVDPPPAGLAHGDHYDVKINFELNTAQETTE